MSQALTGLPLAVTQLHVALFGPGAGMSEADLAVRLSQASQDLHAYANAQASGVSSAHPAAADFAALVLGHLGVLPNAALLDAVAAYYQLAGTHERGFVTLQLAQLLAGLVGDPTFGAAASAWNANVQAAYDDWAVDDRVVVGDAWNDGDHFDGSGGINTIVIGFTTATDPVRQARMQRFQIAEVAFHAPVTFDATQVSDLQRVDLMASDQRARFANLSGSVNELVVHGPLSAGLEWRFTGVQPLLDVRFADQASWIGGAGSEPGLRIVGAQSLNLVHEAALSLSGAGGIALAETPNGASATRFLTVTSQVGHTFEWHAGAATPGILTGTGALESLQLKAEAGATLRLGGATEALLLNGPALRSVNVDAAADARIHLGRIAVGSLGVPPALLETLSIDLAAGAQLTSWGVDADPSSQGSLLEGARIDTASLAAESGAQLHLLGSGDLGVARGAARGTNWLQAAGLGSLTITLHGSAQASGDVDVRMNLDADAERTDDFVVSDLIGLDFETQEYGSLIQVDGQGTLPGLYFHDEVPATLDASAFTPVGSSHTVNLGLLTESQGYLVGSGQLTPLGPVSYAFAVVAGMADVVRPDKGMIVRGTSAGDLVLATDGADVLEGRGGNDLLVAWAGNDLVQGGGGNDLLYGDGLEPAAFGSDTIDGGEGDDLIVGGGNPTGGSDRLTGGAGADEFAFVFDSDNLPYAGYTESGKTGSGVRPDLIVDFDPSVDRIVIDHAANVNSFTIAYFDTQGGAPYYIGGQFDRIQVVIRRGNYHPIADLFTQDPAGADLQVLFMADADEFPGGISERAVIAQYNGGGLDFQVAAHEIGLLGVGGQIGAFGLAQIQFV